MVRQSQLNASKRNYERNKERRKRQMKELYRKDKEKSNKVMGERYKVTKKGADKWNFKIVSGYLPYEQGIKKEKFMEDKVNV